MGCAGKIIGNDVVYLWHLAIRKYAKCIWNGWRNQLNRWKNTEKVSNEQITDIIAIVSGNTNNPNKFQHCFIEENVDDPYSDGMFIYLQNNKINNVFILVSLTDTLQNCRLSKQYANGNVPVETTNSGFGDERLACESITTANDNSIYHQLSLRRESGCSGIYEEISISPDAVKRYNPNIKKRWRIIYQISIINFKLFF